MRMIPLYIDVAVMSATIEAIVGVVIAVSAFLIIRFRKAKKKVQETLHLEDSAKETEGDVVLLDDEIEKAPAEAAEPGAEFFEGGSEVSASGPEETTGA
ncbi:MAG: FeoB-associated Cys-rich membrane protein [Lachnospiraceae bacterium]|nr:FeoB-associated Cys-rich membrane protein [Lachnospiraceae bacterium]